MTEKDIYLAGDIKYTLSSPALTGEESVDFLLELQALMEKYGVVKLDICMDVFKLKHIRDSTIHIN